jgi:hypothetical protein
VRSPECGLTNNDKALCLQRSRICCTESTTLTLVPLTAASAHPGSPHLGRSMRLKSGSSGIRQPFRRFSTAHPPNLSRHPLFLAWLLVRAFAGAMPPDRQERQGEGLRVIPQKPEALPPHEPASGLPSRRALNNHHLKYHSEACWA